MNTAGEPDRPPGWITPLQISAALLLILASSAAIVWAALRSPEIPFVADTEGAQWIGFPAPMRTQPIITDHDAIPVVQFERDFSLNEACEGNLRVKAMRGIELELNGQVLLAAPWTRADWKRERILSTGSLLRAGTNQLRARVRNPQGPALLWSMLRGPCVEIRSDAAWSVARGRSPTAKAVRLPAARPHPATRAVPGPRDALRAKAIVLVALFAIGAGLSGTARKFRGQRRLPLYALVAVHIYWAVLFSKMLAIPDDVGFDALGHRAYIDFIVSHGSLPDARDGWSMYHPPLFFALTGAALRFLSPQPGGLLESFVLHGIPAAAGLSIPWLCFLGARRLFSGDPERVAMATVFGGTLPMAIYIAAYVSNESLHAALAGAALLTTCTLIGTRKPSIHQALLCGLVLGMALLAKFTSVLWIPLIAAFIAMRFLGRKLRVGWACRALLAFFAGWVGVAGWYYWGNWLEFGQPLATNLSVLFEDRSLYIDPGFRRIEYYTGFGEALHHPTLAGFASYWDGLYSTLWGDGLIGGSVSIARRPQIWNEPYALLTYPLALPATLLVLAGVGRGVLGSLRGNDLARRAQLAFLASAGFALAASMLYLSLAWPFYQAKSFYALALAMPLALAFASAWSAFTSRLGVAGNALAYGWLSVFLGVSVLAYAS